MSSNSDGEDDIGYGKPPKSGQFRKGQSGNPRGRPKGTKNFQTELDAVLRSKVTIKNDGKSEKITTVAAGLLRLKEKALKGDQKALDRLLDYAQDASSASDARSKERQLSDLEKRIVARSPLWRDHNDLGEVDDEKG